MTTPSAEARATLEALAEFRLSLLAAARRAQETKNGPLAKSLKDQAESLKTVLSARRRQNQEAWSRDTEDLTNRLGKLTQALNAVAHRTDRTPSNAKRIARLLGGVERLLRWTSRTGS
jgi:C4-dicarboxylate-specific signal transduction histidine kinase